MSTVKYGNKPKQKTFKIDERLFGPRITLEYQEIINKHKKSQERIAQRKNEGNCL